MKKYFWIFVLVCLLVLTGLLLAEEEKTVSLEFRDTDIKTVLSAFSKQTGLNVITDEKVTGKVSVNISNMEPVSALELLLDAYGYSYYFRDNSIIVSTSRISDSLEMRSFSLRYARASDIKDMLEKQIDAKIGEAISISNKLNAVSVTASPTKMRMIAKIIRGVDVPPAQVLIEAKIIELKSGSGDSSQPSSLGVNWKIKDNKIPPNYLQLLTSESLTSGATAQGLFGYFVSDDGNISAYLSALEKTIGYDLIAQPSLTVLNHEEAEILIGAKYGYKTLIVSQTSTTEVVNFMEVGTKLKLTPHINDQGYIVMDIYPAVSEGQVIEGLPQETTTETKSRVLVKDGQSIIVGGLTKHYNNQVEIGVPILMHIPIIGMLFKRTELKSEKRDIIIIITPKVISPGILEKMSEKTKHMEREQKREAGKHQLIHF